MGAAAAWSDLAAELKSQMDDTSLMAIGTARTHSQHGMNCLCVSGFSCVVTCYVCIVDILCIVYDSGLAHNHSIYLYIYVCNHVCWPTVVGEGSV